MLISSIAMLMYRFRIYPRTKQRIRLQKKLEICKKAYNELLALSIDAYKFGNVSLNKYDYNNYLKDKDLDIHSQVLQNVSDRVSKAFQNFYRRLKDKKCKKKGFPRFKRRAVSMTYPQSGFKIINKHLHCSRIGRIPIILHRKMNGKIKTLTIKQNNANHWFAIFSVENNATIPKTAIIPIKNRIFFNIFSLEYYVIILPKCNIFGNL